MAYKQPNCKETPPHAPACSCATPPEKQWAVIGRGLNGWHAKSQDGNTSSSGGNIDNYTYWTGQRCYGYAAEAIEGCMVYDAKEANPDAFARLIISGPMVNPKLTDEEADLFTDADRDTAARMTPALDGEFKTIAALGQMKTYSGLDYVSVATYRRLLAAVPGMKLGTIHNGIVVWDDPLTVLAAAGYVQPLTDAPFSLTPEASQRTAHQAKLFNGTE